MISFQHNKWRSLFELVAISILSLLSVIVLEISSMQLFSYFLLVNIIIFSIVIYLTEYSPTNSKLAQTHIPLVLVLLQLTFIVYLSRSLTYADQDLFLSLILSGSFLYALHTLHDFKLTNKQ